MAAISQKIPNLLGGVSQQPDPVKLPGQVREATNTYLDPTFGCRKRPGTDYIKTIATDIPADVKWFPIFRDNNERYAVAIYANPDPTVRVWSLNSGEERTVNMSQISTDYLNGFTPADIRALTIADYTLITNPDRIITMAEATAPPLTNESLVLVEQVAYNTTYSVDFQKDGDTETTPVYKAAAVEISPGSFEGDDGGSCTEAGPETFTVSDGAKTGLSFRIDTNCAAYWKEIDGGLDRYFSRYTTEVYFLNGGVGWRVGDEVVVTKDNRDYTVRVTEESFEYAYNSLGSAAFTTPSDPDSGPLAIGDVLNGLSTAIEALDGLSAESIGSVIKITSTNERDYNISTRGGTSDQALDAIKGTATDIAQLPSQCFDGYTLKVSNTDDATADDYYVKFESATAGIPGAGSWQETVAPGVRTTINSSTLPQALVREADGNFTLAPLNSDSAFGGWAQRFVGDEGTNPDPTFVGQGISDLFFYVNRLGVLSQDSVIMSQPGDYFNFFSTSAIALSDSDPIDLTASSTSPAILKSAIGSPKGLILFAERSQFLLSTNEVAFASSTVQLTEMSNYFYRSAVAPLNGGSSIAFLAENASYSKVLEMATDSVENRPQVADITKNIPEYLPSNFKWGSVLPNNDMFVFGKGDEEIYIFKYFNNGDTRELAGWSKWVYPANVQMFESEDDLIHVILNDGEKTVYCRSELVDDPNTAPMSVGFSSFSPRIDISLTSSQVTVAPLDAFSSSITVAADRFFSDAEYIFMVTDGAHKGTYIYPEVTTNEDGSGTFTVLTNLLGDDFVVGCEYVYKLVLPNIFTKQENIADRTNVPMVSFVHLDLYYSGHYKVTLEKLGYTTKTIEVEQTFANVYDAGAAPVTEINQYTIPVFGPGDTVNLTIEGTGPYPSSITGYSWDGTYFNRGVQNFR